MALHCSLKQSSFNRQRTGQLLVCTLNETGISGKTAGHQEPLVPKRSTEKKCRGSGNTELGLIPRGDKHPGDFCIFLLETLNIQEKWTDSTYKSINCHSMKEVNLVIELAANFIHLLPGCLHTFLTHSLQPNPPHTITNPDAFHFKQQGPNRSSSEERLKGEQLWKVSAHQLLLKFMFFPLHHSFSSVPMLPQESLFSQPYRCSKTITHGLQQ